MKPKLGRPRKKSRDESGDINEDMMDLVDSDDDEGERHRNNNDNDDENEETPTPTEEDETPRRRSRRFRKSGDEESEELAALEDPRKNSPWRKTPQKELTPEEIEAEAKRREEIMKRRAEAAIKRAKTMAAKKAAKLQRLARFQTHAPKPASVHISPHS